MSKKKLKYERTRGDIDTEYAALKAITVLDIAGLKAQAEGDAQAMATVALGWAIMSHSIFNIESASSEMEVAELQADTERIINKVGFSPGRYEEDEDDED